MDALAQVRQRLKARALDPDAETILAAFEELERRVGICATALLHQHYFPNEPMHEATWKSLSEMSEAAGAMYRIGEPGEVQP